MSPETHHFQRRVFPVNHLALLALVHLQPSHTSLYPSLTILMAIFQVNLCQLVFTEAGVDGSGGDNCCYKSYKTPVKSSLPTNQHSFFTGWMPSYCPTNSVKALKGNQARPTDTKHR